MEENLYYRVVERLIWIIEEAEKKFEIERVKALGAKNSQEQWTETCGEVDRDVGKLF